MRPSFLKQTSRKFIMILLNRSVSGYLAGTIAQFSTNKEAALIAQGFGSTSAGPVTSGAVTTTETSGRVTFAIAAASLVVTNANVDANSKIYAVINQAAADGTALRVERIVPAAGSFTIFVTAGATAATVVDWILLDVSGDTPPVNSTL